MLYVSHDNTRIYGSNVAGMLTPERDQGTRCPRHMLPMPLRTPSNSQENHAPTVLVDSWLNVRRAGKPRTNSCLTNLCFVFLPQAKNPSDLFCQKSYLSATNPLENLLGKKKKKKKKKILRKFSETFRNFHNLSTNVDMDLELILRLA